MLRRVRHRCRVHPVARQQRERGGQRQLVAPRHAAQPLALAFLVQLAAQIGRDAGHMRGADDLHPRLFQRVIRLLGLAGGRGAGGMERVVMVAQAQRQRIGHAAQLRHLRGGQRPRRGGQAGPLAGQARRAGLVGHLHVSGLGDRAQRARGGALEILGLALVVSGHVASHLLRAGRSRFPR